MHLTNPSHKHLVMLLGLTQIINGLVVVLSFGFLHTNLPMEAARKLSATRIRDLDKLK